jgi:phage terminase small subunit
VAGKKPDKRGELSAKEKRFVEEYLVDLNGSQAAIRAGYSPRSAGEMACELLTRPQVSDAITKRQNERARRNEVTQDQVIRELCIIAFADMRNYAQWGMTEDARRSMDQAEAENQGLDPMQRMPPNGVMLRPSDELTDEQARAVREVSETTLPSGGIKYGIKLYDKIAALKLLGQHLGMFKGEPKEGDRYSWVQIVMNAASRQQHA